MLIKIRPWEGYDKDFWNITIVVDAGYYTSAIAKLLINGGVAPILPYKSHDKRRYCILKYEYVNDEH